MRGGRGGITTIAAVSLRSLAGLAPIGFVALFLIAPLTALLARSLEGGMGPLAAAFADEHNRAVAGFTIAQAVASTALTLALGLPAAALFARYQFPGKTAWRAFAAAPFVLPAIVTASAFTAWLGPRGLVNTAAMSAFDLSDPPLQLQNTLALMLLAHVFYNFAIVLRMVSGMWSALDPEYERAAAVLGASRLRVLREITLPLLLPAVASATFPVFLFCFTAFGTVLLLAGPRFATIEVEIYTQATQFLNLPAAAALSIAQMAVTITLSYAQTRVQRRFAARVRLRPTTSAERPLRGPAAHVLAASVLGAITLLVGGPLSALVVRALSGLIALDFRPLAALFERPATGFFAVAPIEAVGNSFAYAALTVIVTLVVGLPAAYLVSARGRASPLRFGARSALDALFMLPLGAPSVTLGLGYIIAFGAPPLDLRTSAAAVPIAHALIAFPFVVRSLVPALDRIDPKLREAARVHGADAWGVIQRVDAPLVLRGALVAVGYAFSISMGEFGASVVLARPDAPTIPVVIYRYLGQPGLLNYTTALVMSCVLLAVSMAAFAVIERTRLGEGEAF